MPLISKILRMNGRMITTPLQFRDFFSPGDFLRNKELAAYFAIRNMAQTSPANAYFSELLNIAVLHVESLCKACQLPPEDCIRSARYAATDAAHICPLAEVLQHAKSNSILFCGYWDADVKAGTKGWNKERNDALMASIDQNPFRMKVRQQVQQIVGCTGLTGLEKFQLDLLLSMGYLLAGWLPEERPISPAEAEAAFLGKEWVQEVTFRDTPEGRIYPARTEPYLLSLRESSILPYGETITLRKLIAEPSTQGNSDMPVIFQLPGRLEMVMPGDYRYASFVGDEMIRLYPAEKKNGNRILRREGSTLYLTDTNGTLLQKIPCKEQNIVDMMPAPQGEEWILLTPGHVDYRNFSDKGLPSSGIVELRMAGNTVFLLTELGEVRRHGYPTNISLRATMDGIDL